MSERAMNETTRFLTVRRAGSEAGISLRKRRMWFADDPAQADAQKPAGEQKPPADKGDGDGEQKTFSAAYVKELRDEAADWRKQFKALKVRLDEIETNSKTAEEKKLADQQEFKTLAEKKATEAADWKAKYEAAEQKSLRLQVAADFKLPPAAAKRLVGTTEEELRADAEELAKLIPAQSQQQTQPTDKEGSDKKPQPDAGEKQPGGSQTTTGVPGGQPKTGRTDEERRSEYFGGARNSPFFESKGGVVYHGNPADLE